MNIHHEEILIAKAQENLQEFTGLYELYGKKIYRYFALRIQRKEKAEDLTSCTFLKALEHFENYQFTGKPFGVWLFKIAHNVLIDSYRQSKHQTQSIEYAEDIAAQQDIEKDAHLKLLAEKIYKLLEEFSEEEKEILLLKLNSGLTFFEIASILGKKESTIKTKYFRNVQRLRARSEDFLLLLCTLHLFL